MDVFNAPITTETCKVGAYVDDVKPGITSLAEFDLVDRGSAIFGCILHRDASKGKVNSYRMEAKRQTPWPSKSGYSITIHCPFKPPGYGVSQVKCKLPQNSLNKR